MKGIVVASHGRLAEGIADSAALFFGEQAQFAAVCIHAGENAEDFYKTFLQTVTAVDSGDGVLVLCDILSGTPCNCAVRALASFGDRMDILCGVNLPMVLQALADREAGELDPALLCEQAAAGILDVRAALAADDDEDE